MKRLLTCGLALLLLAVVAAAQTLPSKVRGYKVHTTNVVVRVAGAPDAKNADLLVKLAPPNIKSIGLTGTTVEIAAEITALDKSGAVDLVTFQDFTVNGIVVEIDDQTAKFTFKKNVAIALPPANVRIGPLNSAKAGYRELTASKTDWRVTGTVLVFGKFKRFGFTFKRVIPIKIDLTIPNPIRK